MKEVMMD